MKRYLTGLTALFAAITLAAPSAAGPTPLPVEWFTARVILPSAVPWTNSPAALTPNSDLPRSYAGVSTDAPLTPWGYERWFPLRTFWYGDDPAWTGVFPTEPNEEGPWMQFEVAVTDPASGEMGVARLGRYGFQGTIGLSSASLSVWSPSREHEKTIEVGGNRYSINTTAGGFTPLAYPWLTLDAFTGLAAVTVTALDQTSTPEEPSQPSLNPEPASVTLAALAVVGCLGASVWPRVRSVRAA